jgi:hypothetical protein
MVPLGGTVMSDECPYYLGDYKQCNISGVSQSDGQRSMYCRTVDEWKRCANYSTASYDYRKSKALRPNPDL